MSAENFEKFLERLNSLRGERSVVSFARDCGIPQQTMANYCKGERIPSLEAFERLCYANVVSADWLLGFTNDRHGTAAPVTNPVLEAKLAEKDAEIARLNGVIEGLRLAFATTGKGK